MSQISLIEYRKPHLPPAHSLTLKEVVVGFYTLKNKLLVVLQSRVFVYQVNQGYKEYLIETGKQPVVAAMCQFPNKTDKYGLVVVNKKESKGPCEVDIHNFVDGEYLMHNRFTLDELAQPTGQVTAICFSQQRDLLYLYQEDQKLIWVYNWMDSTRLVHVTNIPLFHGMSDFTDFPKVHQFYNIWANVFLLFFKNGSFRLIDCDVVIKKSIIFKSFFQFNALTETNLEDGELDPLSAPVVFVSFVRGGMSKPTAFRIVG